MLKISILLAVLFTAIMAAISSDAEARILSGELLVGNTEQSLGERGSYIPMRNGKYSSFGLRGLYELNRYFAVELGINTFAEKSSDEPPSRFFAKGELMSTSYNLGLKASWPFDNGLSLNSRFGGSLWDINRETNRLNEFHIPQSTIVYEGKSFYYGFGVQYKISSTTYIGIEYNATQMNIPYHAITFDFKVKNSVLYLGYQF
ncbi:outer membrane beta-barrel protein [Algibacillus agarilyticus]|uniref:outer membrane beta-barrel protein n=1 Tax=Algibacillus agarilyticus TaxID=2234133 RepID=UPI000DCFC959|nr:outer membrane beta-barrel protein [Algibacillus agarilyticus]